MSRIAAKAQTAKITFYRDTKLHITHERSFSLSMKHDDSFINVLQTLSNTISEMARLVEPHQTFIEQNHVILILF